MSALTAGLTCEPPSRYYTGTFKVASEVKVQVWPDGDQWRYSVRGMFGVILLVGNTDTLEDAHTQVEQKLTDVDPAWKDLQ